VWTVKANDLRPGVACRFDGKLFVVTKFEHRTPGNLRAFIQIKIRDVNSGQYLEKRLASTDEIDIINLDRREMEYLYADTSGMTFMDTSTYDQVTLADEFVGEAKNYLTSNQKCVMLFHDIKPLSIELPASVDLTVSDTAPGVRNATATNQLKEATLETGLKTRVPAFIGQGERVRVSTTDGSYQSRSGD
jgi:elongation factor P